MLTVEAHHQWEQRYREYDHLKQLITDAQAQLSQCPTNGCLAPSIPLATDSASDLQLQSCTSTIRPALAQPRAVRALAIAT